MKPYTPAQMNTKMRSQ